MGCCCSQELSEDHEDEESKEIRTPLLSNADGVSVTQTQPSRKYESVDETHPKEPRQKFDEDPPLPKQPTDKVDPTDKLAQEHQSTFKEHQSRYRELQDIIRSLESKFPETNPDKSVKGCILHVKQCLGDQRPLLIKVKDNNVQNLELEYRKLDLDPSTFRAVEEFNQAGSLVKELLSRGPQLSKSARDTISRESELRKGASGGNISSDHFESNMKELKSVVDGLDQIQREVIGLCKSLESGVELFEDEVNQKTMQENTLLIGEGQEILDQKPLIHLKPDQVEIDSTNNSVQPPSSTPIDSHMQGVTGNLAKESPESQPSEITSTKEVTTLEQPKENGGTQHETDSADETHDIQPQQESHTSEEETSVAVPVSVEATDEPSSESPAHSEPETEAEPEEKVEASVKLACATQSAPVLEHDGPVTPPPIVTSASVEHLDQSPQTEGSDDPSQSTCTEDDIFHDTREEDSLNTNGDISPDQSAVVSDISLENAMDEFTLSSDRECTEDSSDYNIQEQNVQPQQYT